MKLIAPYTGVVVEASDEAAARLMEQGYQEHTPKKTGRKADEVEPVEAKPQAAEKPEKPKHRKAK